MSQSTSLFGYASHKIPQMKNPLVAW